MKEFTPTHIDALKQLIESGNEEQLRELLTNRHPADIAEFLADLHDVDDQLLILRQLDDETAADKILEASDTVLLAGNEIVHKHIPLVDFHAIYPFLSA